MGIQIKLHNEGHDRPLAIPTVQHSKHDEVWSYKLRDWRPLPYTIPAVKWLIYTSSWAAMYKQMGQWAIIVMVVSWSDIVQSFTFLNDDVWAINSWEWYGEGCLLPTYHCHGMKGANAQGHGN
jgi:hypothetical protein